LYTPKDALTKQALIGCKSSKMGGNILYAHKNYAAKL
jgi:hypothetical protein